MQSGGRRSVRARLHPYARRQGREPIRLAESVVPPVTKSLHAGPQTGGGFTPSTRLLGAGVVSGGGDGRDALQLSLASASKTRIPADQATAAAETRAGLSGDETYNRSVRRTSARWWVVTSPNASLDRSTACLCGRMENLGGGTLSS